MPDEQQYDLTTAAQDPDFLRADQRDKISFLAAHDKDFAAANPKDQMDYLNHIIPTGQTFQAAHSPSSNETGAWNRTKQFGSDLGRMALGLAGSGFGSPVPTPSKVADAALGYSARRAAGRSPLYSGIASGAEAAGIDPTGMEASAEHGDPVGVGVHAAAQLAPVAAGELSRIPAVRTGASRLAAPIQDLRTPISDTATAAKSAIGDVLVDEMGRPKPIARLALRNERATALGELAKPEIAERRGAQEIRSARDEMYNELGQRRINRGAEQEALDKEQPTGSQIITPGTSEPRVTGSEGRAATWTNEDVMRLARQGNREAIQQAVRRGMELPPGARYVMGEPDPRRPGLLPGGLGYRRDSPRIATPE